MQYLVMQNRIINLVYRDIEINQPMARDQRMNATVSTQAIQSEKYPTRFFRDRLKNVNALSSHLAERINYTLLAVPIHVVVESMHPSPDESDNS